MNTGQNPIGKQLTMAELLALSDERQAKVQRGEVEPLRLCTSCSHAKPESSFAKDNKARDGLQAQCRACKNLAVQTRGHGITKDEYSAMVAAQQGKCAICGRVPKGSLHVDHNHNRRCCQDKNVSCRVCNRGLLCTQCNTGLGMFGDDASTLNKAIEYLTRWNTNG